MILFEGAGNEPISDRVTPHSLRRTFASLRYACGDDPIYVAEQGRWKDPGFPMKVYARAVRRRERLTGAYPLRPFDAALQWAGHGTDWAPTGTSGQNGPIQPPDDGEAKIKESASRAETNTPAPVAQLDRAPAF